MRKVQTDFSKGSVKKLILSQTLPLILSQIVHLLYNIVDRIYIGHMGEEGELAMTGLGIIFPVTVLTAAFASLFNTGGTTLFSISRGKGDTEEAEKLMGTVFTLLSVAALILTVVFFFFRKPIIFAFGASENSYFYADQYLQVYIFGTIFAMLTNMNQFINAQGFPKVGMMTVIIGAVLNIILDPIFIFGLNMRVQGAALATVISQAASCVWVMLFLTGKRAILKLKKSTLGVRWHRFKKIVSLGTSGFIMAGTSTLVSIVTNRQLQDYGGDTHVAIMTMINSIREMVSIPVQRLSFSSQAVLGFNYGAGCMGRVKEGIKFIISLGAGYTMIAWAVIMLIPKVLLGIFSDNPDTIALGARMLNIYFFGFVFMAFQFAAQSTFQGLGKAKQAIFFSLLRKAFIVVPLSLLLPAIGFGVEGVYAAEPVSNVVGGLASFTTMWFTLYRKLEDTPKL